LQSQRPLSFKLFQELKIALFRVTEFTSGLSGTQSLTLAFEKHGQFAGNLVLIVGPKLFIEPGTKAFFRLLSVSGPGL
jgi:hypothetical protein